jgi:hypothetical protein
MKLMIVLNRGIILFGEIILYCKLVLLIKSSFLQFGKKYGRPFCNVKKFIIFNNNFPVSFTFLLLTIKSFNFLFGNFFF